MQHVQGGRVPNLRGGSDLHEHTQDSVLNRARNPPLTIICSLLHCSGAGQEVGRSCVMLEFKGKKIMACIYMY